VTRIVLSGTRSFGAAVLEALVRDGHEIAAVIAPPGDRLFNTAKYDWKLPVTASIDHTQIADLGADLGVAAHSHVYVGRKSRAATRCGWLGYHPSLLPRHRGRDAVEWTIRMRDPIAGGTVYELDDGVDTGPIAVQDWCHVSPRWDASALWREALFPMGVRLLREAVGLPYVGARPQDPRFATWEPSLEAARLHRSELPEIEAGSVR
jgi:methionyl-tRNA formyltransferase